MYFGCDLLDPEDWNDLMIQMNEDSLYCDLVFVQLASNYLKKEIILIPIKQPKSTSEILINKDDLEKNIIKVTPNEKTSNHSFCMLYYPQGEFEPHPYFQSVFMDNQSQNQFACTTTAEHLQNILASEGKKNTGINDDEDSDETSDEEDNHLATSSKERKNPTTKINPKKMKKHPNYRYNDVTMLTPVDPTANVVVNNTKKTIKTKVSKKAPIFEIAPGEGKIPTNWLREKDNDIDSFPELHVEGKYGLDEPRIQKLSRAKYFGQRIMNENTMYSENPDYVFMAQQACERYAIEREIHMAMSHGSIESSEKGEMSLVPSEDAFNIFQKIPGTPAYWKSFKNELYAKMEALGPFHVFFTKSCAEMKWAYVLLEVLKVKLKRNLKIMYLDNFMIDPDGKLENVAWDGETTTVLLYDNDLSDIDLKSNEEKLEDTEEREVELKTQIDKIIKKFKEYQEEAVNEKNDDPEKMAIIRTKLEENC